MKLTLIALCTAFTAVAFGANTSTSRPLNLSYGSVREYIPAKRIRSVRNADRVVVRRRSVISSHNAEMARIKNYRAKLERKTETLLREQIEKLRLQRELRINRRLQRVLTTVPEETYYEYDVVDVDTETEIVELGY